MTGARGGEAVIGEARLLGQGLPRPEQAVQQRAASDPHPIRRPRGGRRAEDLARSDGPLWAVDEVPGWAPSPPSCLEPSPGTPAGPLSAALSPGLLRHLLPIAATVPW
jgi:hypothetical protein